MASQKNIHRCNCGFIFIGIFIVSFVIYVAIFDPKNCISLFIPDIEDCSAGEWGHFFFIKWIFPFVTASILTRFIAKKKGYKVT